MSRQNRWYGYFAFSCLTTLAIGCGLATSGELGTLTAGAADERITTQAGPGMPATPAVRPDAMPLDPPAPQDGRRHPPHRHGPPLTPEQWEALAALRAEYEAGEITQAEFCAAALEVIGPPPCHPPLPPIDLTEEQVAAAEAIFEATRDEIFAIHEAARDDVYALLDDAQAALLLELEAALPEFVPQPLLPPDWPVCDVPDEWICQKPALVPLAQCPPPPPGFDGEQGAGGPPPPPGGFHHGPHPVPLCASPDLITDLALTEAQLDAIPPVHMELRETVEAARDAAREAFRDLLTPEQLEQLEELPPPPGSHHGPRH